VVEPEPAIEAEIEKAVISEDIPEWLQGLGDDETEPTIEPEPVPEAEIEKPAVAAESIPEWLQGLADDETEPTIEPEPAPEAEVKEAAVSEDIPEWLQGLEDDVPEAVEETEPAPKAEVEKAMVSEDIPDWLQSLEDIELEHLAAPEKVLESTTDITSDKSPDVSKEDEDLDVPDWVEDSLGDERIETFPTGVTGWLGDIGQKQIEDTIDTEPIVDHIPEGDTEEVIFDEAEAESEDVIHLPQEIHPEVDPVEIITEDQVSPSDTDQVEEEIGPPGLSDADAAMAWLESLAAKKGVPEEELLSSPEERTDTPPEWVMEIADNYTDDLIATNASGEAIPTDEEISADWISDLVDEPGVKVEDAEAIFGVKPISDEELEEIDIGSEEAISWLESLADSEIQSDSVTESEDELVITSEIETSSEIEEDTFLPKESPEVYETEPIQEVGEVIQLETESEEALETGISEDVSPETRQEDSIQTDTVDILSESDFNDANAAMAWLEGLAAKQGVSEEELLTSPEDRSGKPPEWVQEEAAASETHEQAEELAAETVDDLVEEVPGELEIVVDAEELEAEAVDDLAEEVPGDLKIVVDAEELEAEAVDDLAEEAPGELKIVVDAEELEAEAVDDLEGEIPDKLEMVVDAEEFKAEAVEDLEEEIPDDQKMAVDSEELAAEADADLVEDVQDDQEMAIEDDLSDDLPAFLRERDFEKVSDEAISQEPRVVETTMGEPEPEEISKEVPNWLVKSIEAEAMESAAEIQTPEAYVPADEIDEVAQVGDTAPGIDMTTDQTLPEVEIHADEIDPTSGVIEEKSLEEDEYQWLPGVSEQSPEEVIKHQDTEVDSGVSELLDLNEASMIQLERLPSLGFRSAQAIIAFRDKNGPFEALEGLSKVPDLDEITVNELKNKVKVTAPTQAADMQPEAVGLKALQEVEAVDTFHAQQLAAKADFAGGNFTEGIKKCTALIKKGKRLDDVIEDLTQVLNGDVSNEICVDILKTLGDAHMKADHLQEALDAYTKAEELLR